MITETLKKIWPEWQIEGKPLGRGSFGVVYKAIRREYGMETPAAIKVISIPSDPSEVDSLRSEGLDLNGTKTYLKGVVDDFVSEIKVMESLKGVQNIVSVEDYKVVERKDEIGWDIFIRMELLTSFNAYICDKKLTEAEVIKLGCDICTALEICAKRNIIHRDIKPENIFVNDFGDFKLGDFGIARKLENMTGGLSQKGTYNYMAPEVANSSEYDARVDTYSLGIVLYRLLNGNRLPFLDTEKQLLNPNERRAAIDRRLRGEPLPAPCEASPAMADLILHACAVDPDMRFSSATAMKQALISVSNGIYQINADDLDRTTSVRPAPAAVQKETKSKVSTFGNARKKKSTVAVAAAAALSVVFLAVAAFFIVPKFMNTNSSSDNGEVSGNPSTEHDASVNTGKDTSTSASDSSQSGAYSKFDEEQIASILAEAESFATNEDYESALGKIEAGLAVYPKSQELQNKCDEYTQSLNIQMKEKVLAEAKALADAGNYTGAMTVIKNAQDTQGDNEDYRNAYEAYNAAYISAVKDEAVNTADSLAESGDYLGAVAVIEEAIKTVGNEAGLSEKVEQYTQSYVSASIVSANSFASNKEFVSALAVLNEALLHFPSNSELQKTLVEVEKAQKLANSASVLNPNQNPVMPDTPEELNITGSSGKANAAVIQRENLYHASFTSKGQVDWFSFSTSSNYSAYSVELLNNSIDSLIYVEIFDSYDNQLGKVSVAKGKTGYLDVSLEPNSEYWIQVSRYYESQQGNYQFAVHERICDAGMDQDSAFYVDLGEQYVKSFDVHSVDEWYKFVTTGNYATYQLNLINNSVDTLIYMAVYDEFNTELGKVSASKGKSATLDLNLKANREYTVKLTRYYDDQNGYYQISVSEMICDAGLTQEDAFPLKLNETLYGTADTSFAEWYVYSFTATGTYTMSLTNNNIDTSLYATVYDVLGTELGRISASKGKTSENSLKVNAGTVLYVKLSRYYEDEFGNYTLRVE